MTSDRYLQTAQQFVTWLEAHKDDRSVLAHLRRGLSPATEHYAWPHIAAFCELDRPSQRVIYTTVAGCFAFHPQNVTEGNLGTMMKKIAFAQHRAEDALNRFESRFARVLACQSVAELCQQIRLIVRLARSHDVGVNYLMLLRDLLRWDRSPLEIRVAWALEYYGSRQKSDKLEQTPSGVDPTSAG